MKRIALLFIISILVNGNSMAYDHVIMRDGHEMDVKLLQINDSKIVFGSGAKNGVQQEVESKDVYMVYIENQGNVYITPTGKRITGEQNRVDSKRYDVIYLVSGAEIGASNIKLMENLVCYSVEQKKTTIGRKPVLGPETCLDKQDVFMIRYRSGMRDIITPIELVEDTVAVVEKKTVEPVVQKEEEEKKPEYVVSFHSVAKKETLAKVAEKYNVTPAQIIEWNDLPAKMRVTVPLTTGMQLMIYQPKEKK